MEKQVRVQINRQWGKVTEASFSVNAGALEKDDVSIEVREAQVDGCQLGTLHLDVHPETLKVGCNLEMEKPVQAFLQMHEKPQAITAIYMFNPWWTRPAFVKSFRDIPDRTQIVLFKYEDRCACFVPMIGEKFKACLNGGTENELCLEMTAYVGGLAQIHEPLYLYAEGKTTAEAVHKAFTWLAKEKNIPLRENRRIPEMLRYLGWCSWDAFYTEVTEKKLRQKADEFALKQVPVNWMLIDDGWFSVKGKCLYDFAPDQEKFPRGFRPMIDDIRGKSKVRWFGVWHALGGYWDGVAPESPLALREAAHLYHTADGKTVPSPETGSGFYRDWYELLHREGIDFVKVDGQSAIPHYFANSIPVSEAARGMNRSLESGAYRMDNAVINCMGMAMENILARPASAVSRNSDDFTPKLDNFAEHLLQNAYNALYHNEIYCCDWDMFWTKHKYAEKHSLLRAVSGGPVYFSDEIGDTVPEILEPLTYTDGELLMMDRSARPTEDCVFRDPFKEGVLKLHNTAPWGSRKAGGIAAYNLTGEMQNVAFTAADVSELEACGEYWVYDFFGKNVRSISRGEAYTDTIPAEGFAWYVLLPRGKNGACLGRLDKYVGFSAVESAQETENTQTIVLHESGPVGWLADHAPEKVFVHATDVTETVTRDGNLYTLDLPVKAEKSVISVIW